MTDAITEMAAAMVAGCLHGRRFRWSDEKELQDGIAEALTRDEVAFEREVTIRPGCRIDFVARPVLHHRELGAVPGRVGVEVKVQGATAGVLAQLLRYAQSEAIDGLVLVTDKSLLAALPDVVGGKPLHVVALWGGLR